MYAGNYMWELSLWSHLFSMVKSQAILYFLLSKVTSQLVERLVLLYSEPLILKVTNHFLTSWCGWGVWGRCHWSPHPNQILGCLSLSLHWWKLCASLRNCTPLAPPTHIQPRESITNNITGDMTKIRATFKDLGVVVPIISPFALLVCWLQKLVEFCRMTVYSRLHQVVIPVVDAMCWMWYDCSSRWISPWLCGSQ